ncbi:hypothetical protein ACSBR1_015740 [Camellia fascicularis]
MEQGGNGGWISVVRQRKRSGAQGKEVNYGPFTIFVDNLPKAMDVKSPFKLFTKFSIVKDVFIPFKRRKVTDSRFGFVRFDCHVAADIAIQKANGLLVDDMVLEVKNATYDRSNGDEQSRRRPRITRRPFETSRNRGKVSYVDQRSFAEVLKGDTSSVAGKASVTIKVNKDGHGWLYKRALIRLNTEYSIHNIKKALKKKGLD